jgi:hypothetical protein
MLSCDFPKRDRRMTARALHFRDWTHSTREMAPKPNWLSITGVTVEKLHLASKRPKFRGYKMPRKSRKSFVGHPNAKFFRSLFSE